MSDEENEAIELREIDNIDFTKVKQDGIDGVIIRALIVYDVDGTYDNKKTGFVKWLGGVK